MMPSLSSIVRLVPGLVSTLTLAATLTGCPAVFPELQTRTRPIAPGLTLDPPPPEDVRFLRVASATVPDHTRDGRKWQASGKANPYAKVLVNEKELFKTPPQSDTLTPTWPNGPHGNFRIKPEDKMRVELWDSNTMNDVPIGLKELGRVGDLHPFEGKLRIELDEGADMTLVIEPAHAVQGLGLWFELRTTGAGITRLLAGSPAERKGLVAGDDVLKIGDRDANAMSPDELRSAFNAPPMDGLKLLIRHAQGTTTEITVKEGPIYPLFEQFGNLD